jgi:alanyl-tRNA synthetase
LQSVETIGERQVLIQRVNGIDGKSTKDTVYELTLEVNNLVAIVGGEYESKPYLVVGVSKALSESQGIDASKLVRELATEIDGGGGGQKFLAMAGGKNSKGLQRALDRAKSLT